MTVRRQSSHDHRQQRREDDDDVREHRARGVGHDRLDAPDVVREPALDLAGARLREEAQRHPLEVGVERVTQVLHHVLPDLVVDVGLADADGAADDRDDDHHHDEQVQQEEVLLRDRDVEQELEQVRVDDTQEARHDDRDHHDDDLLAIGSEEGGDASHRASASLARHGREVRAAPEAAAATATTAAHTRDPAAGARSGARHRPSPIIGRILCRLPSDRPRRSERSGSGPRR